MKDARARAARCIAAVVDGQSLSTALPKAQNALAVDDQKLVAELCYGTLRFYPRLVALASPLLKKPLRNKDYDVYALILLGLYQLEHMATPDHAAINTTVSGVKALGKTWARGLVNGVLRNFQRGRETMVSELRGAEELAHPEWLYNAINDAWPEHASAIMAANNSYPPFCLRVNRRKISQADYFAKLQDARCAEFAPDAIRLVQARPVKSLPGWDEAEVSVQDESAQLAATLLDVADGQRVLDACAAPGGKTCHVLEVAEVDLLALDIEEARLLRVRENLARLGLTATVKAGDALTPEHWWDGRPFDRILLDAPCSATGVIRRNPDIKLHRTPKDITALQKTQLAMLQSLWATLVEGGKLLYATCSIFPAENEEVIAQFLASESGASEVPLQSAGWGLERRHGRQILTSLKGPDGFYYCLLEKAYNSAS